jgi:hypothetical protein
MHAHREREKGLKKSVLAFINVPSFYRCTKLPGGTVKVQCGIDATVVFYWQVEV